MRGLMERESLAEDRGMIFIFSDEKIRSFWMKNTLIPLDLIFMAADGRVVDIKKDFLPCQSDPCETYSSAGPAKYVLEINAGQVDKNNIKPGDPAIIK